MKKKMVLLIAALAVLSICSLFVGVSNITPMDVLIDPARRSVFFYSRWPRLVSVLLVGAGMSVAGVVMQQITSNRFVSPTTAGTLEFTKLGVLIAMLAMPAASMGFKLVWAFLLALGGSWIFLFIINRIKLKDAIFIPLVGMMFGGIVQSVTTFIGYRFDLIQNIDSWMLGRFALIISGRYELVLLGIPILALIYFYADRFTIAGMGDSFARSLGLNHRMVVNLGLVLCSLMSAAIVVTVGSIPFIGVIVPNIVSLYMGDNIKKTLPFIALSGAFFVLACDVFGRLVIYPHEIPISVTAGVIGSAVFLYLILKKRKARSYAASDTTKPDDIPGENAPVVPATAKS